MVMMVEDSILIARFLDGDSSSMDEIFNRYKARVYNYIKLLVGSPVIAEDILQETFVKVITYVTTGKYTENGKFLPWLYRIAHNIVIDYYRSSKKTSLNISKDSVEFDIMARSGQYADAADHKIMNDQTANLLKELVDKLPLEQKDVVIMRHYYNMSFEEIAERTNVSINTALGRMRYALINLRKMMNQRVAL